MASIRILLKHPAYLELFYSSTGFGKKTSDTVGSTCLTNSFGEIVPETRFQVKLVKTVKYNRLKYCCYKLK